MRRPRSIRKLALILAAVAAIALLCVLAFALLTPAPTLPSPSQTLVAAADGLDSIVIDATLDVAHASLTVQQTLRLQNRTGQAQSAAVLRTYPNAFESAETSPCGSDELYDSCYPGGFSTGSLVMREALTAKDGAQEAPAVYRYLDDAKTVLCVPIAGEWQPYEWVTLKLSYTVNIPKAAYRFGVWDGIWALGNCFATPALWQDGAYRTDDYLPVGDPLSGECANYTVSLSVPEGMLCAASGYPTATTADGRTLYQFSALAVRDFSLVLSDRLTVATATQGDVLVCAYATSSARANTLLDYAKRSLACFSERYGAYPYQSYTLAEVSFPMGGMEYPAMVMISADVQSANDRTLEYVVAHETAHQWWSMVLGSDSVRNAWQDEALCDFSVLDYIQARYGLAEREQYRQTNYETAMRITVPRGVTPGAPLSSFSSMSQYTLMTYKRGAAMLCALNDAMGGGLNGFLRHYYERYAFKFATRSDFEQLLIEYSGQDYAPLMTDYLDTYILT